MWNIDSVTGLIALEGEIERQANLMAYTNDFRLLTFIILACLPLVFLMRRSENRVEEDEIKGDSVEKKGQIPM